MKYFELNTDSRQIYQKHKNEFEKYVIDDPNKYYYRSCCFQEIENLFKNGIIYAGNQSNYREPGVFYFSYVLEFSLDWNSSENYIVQYNTDILRKQKGFLEPSSNALEWFKSIETNPAYFYDMGLRNGESYFEEEFREVFWEDFNNYLEKNPNILPEEVNLHKMAKQFDYFGSDDAVCEEIRLEHNLINNIFISFDGDIKGSQTNREYKDYHKTNTQKDFQSSLEYNNEYFQALKQLENLLEKYTY
jgi:hypothetical protein